MAKKKQQKQQKQQGESRARGPNWTTIEILKLIEAWRIELDTPAEKGESTALLNTRVFEQFKTLCGGTTSRSEKAVIDKKNNLPVAYKFIVAFNNNRVVGSTGQPCWFELSREQKKTIKAANKTDARNADMDIAVFNALKNILGVVETKAFSLTTSLRRQVLMLQTDAMVNKLEEIRADRHAALRQRVKEKQESREHQERERERDRQLLRELFGRRD
ncbi:Erythroid differentiation-related factor 1 [Phytophthora cinnamomi]|uniref:Erythroid differentiation-related factor 1 n=1 Tax=Phytophthora cinnamomi TaxID=4785 RepID=UPI0035594DF0|nr:Erythroid differentiation-related factor 1 [Phytophthora cinnamomi]